MNGAENTKPMRATSFRFGLFATLAVVGCANADAAKMRDLTLSEVSEIETGIVVLAHPFNCALSSEDARRLNLAGEDGRLAVRVFFLASPADSLAVERAATDLGLEVPYASLSAEHAASLFRATGMRTPMFALMRHRRVVAMVGNVDADYALDIIDGIVR